jgi:phosphoribosylamine---glycine ligase
VKVLVIGGGGREHALCWAFARTTTVFCGPGNAGTAYCATNLPIDVRDHRAVLDAVKTYEIDLTVVGPEGPLAAGLVDDLAKSGYRAFGPTAAAARIEASKAFAKDVMRQAGVATAGCECFTDRDAALAYVDGHAEPLVVKASGLAAGKGAVVCATRQDAKAAVEQMFDGLFGAAGSIVLIEEYLEGEELSVFGITDGEQVVLLPPSQDHKRLLEGDRGPNTGGMGAYAPVSLASPQLLDTIEQEIFVPTLRELAHRGSRFAGVLYAGLMIPKYGAPSVVEFNCRFGDPEAQVVLPILEGELLAMVADIADSSWRPETTRLSSTGAAVTTVLAAPGYPTNPQRGAVISVPDPLPDKTILFHAGTRRDGDVIRVSGGRVLNATGCGHDVRSAAVASRELAEAVQFDGKVYRRDIGWREAARAANGSRSVRS